MVRTVTDLNKKYDAPQSLMKETHNLLKGEDLLKLHRQTDIPYHWLLHFYAGSIVNPSVNRIQYLWEKLTKTKLQTKDW